MYYVRVYFVREEEREKKRKRKRDYSRVPRGNFQRMVKISMVRRYPASIHNYTYPDFASFREFFPGGISRMQRGKFILNHYLNKWRVRKK